MIHHLPKLTKVKHVLSVLALLLLGQLTFAQDHQTIKGVITDARNKEPLAGATIKLEGTTYATSTDAQGNYTLNATVKDGAYTLTISFTGYKPITKSVTLNHSAITVSTPLAENALSLSEVVVTGTTVAVTKKQLGNAISTVSGKDLNRGLATGVDQALAGKVAGAEVSQNSGNPDGGISVHLRGNSTIAGSSDPLYIIDGVIVNNNSDQLIDLGGYTQNRLADINPADIDHIEVIKGAAGAAIYGSRASNGVVQIFTKKGRSGQPTVTVSTDFRDNSLRKKLAYNTYPFAFANTNVNDQTKIPVTRYDLQKQIFTNAGGTDDNVSVSGGNDNTQYYVSAGYLFNGGIVKSTDFQRGTARARIDTRLNDWLKATVGFSYIYDAADQMPNGGINQQYGALTGFIFGNNNINPFPNATGVYPTLSPAGLQRTNPLEAIAKFKFRQSTSRFIGNINLAATPTKNLSINYTLGYDNSTELGTAYIPIGNTTPTYNTGFSSRADKIALLLNNDLTVAYKAHLTDKLESSTSIGGTIQTAVSNADAVTGTQLSPVSQISSGAATITTAESRSTLNIMGLYAQETFGYMNKIYLTGAIRNDVASSFGISDRWQYYPKLSGTYLLSEESFWKNSRLADIIPDLKLRASYGQNGNLTAIGPYDRFTNYTSVSLPGLPGLGSPSQLGNTDVKPERQTEKEIGIDASFLHNRLGLEFSWYDKAVRDLLLPVTLRPSTGYNTQYQNIGNMTNKGIELLVRGIPVQTTNFKWDVTAIFNAYRNKVFNIPGRVVTFPNGFGEVAAVEGYPLGSYYATYAARNPNGSLLLTPAGLPQLEKSGRDQNGQPTGSPLSKVIGDANPKWTGSLTNEFEIGKAWSIRMQWDFSYGAKLFDFTRRVGDRDIYGGLAGYMPELEGKVKKGYSAAIYSAFDYWIDNGSYAKLRELSASYTLHWRVLGDKPLRISVYGRNLFCISKYPGWDPETNAAGQSTAVRGFDFVEVPIPRTIGFGLNYTF
ncbi:SusC/RagA family TonB-linked outer membrane protein [Puia sp.]|uniref:SusC/RagA family TonB-linked outer membrane protein n=1 Tax=Puia sp. TaxID=2045100 RepID=UPI002F42A1A1